VIIQQRCAPGAVRYDRLLIPLGEKVTRKTRSLNNEHCLRALGGDRGRMGPLARPARSPAEPTALTWQMTARRASAGSVIGIRIPDQHTLTVEVAGA
jgi:hypothetical protein